MIYGSIEPLKGSRCQRQIEMSQSLPSRNVRFAEQSGGARFRVKASTRVAPKRMPKAEATTGLAPKKASATDSLLAANPPPEGFGLEKQFLLSLVNSATGTVTLLKLR